MSSRDSSSGQRPSRLARVDLGFDEQDDLDYSEQAGPSNPSRHMASRPPLPPPPPFRPPSRPDSHHYRPFHDPRSARSYHDLDQTPSHPSSWYTRPVRPPHQPPLQARVSTPSPEPDKDVLAYILAQAQDASTSVTAQEQQLAEQLKRDKFQHGAGKVKSRVQKEREAEQRKKKQAEQDAARAYDEFVAAMQGEVNDGPNNNDRSENGTQPARKPMSAFVGVGGKAYVGSRAETQASTSPPKEQVTRKEPSLGKRVSTAFGSEQDSPDESHSPPPRKEATGPPRKRQAINSFLSELQSSQAERESRLSNLASSTNTSISTLLAHETLAKPGSRDLVSDPLTTNICIVSLPPNVDERDVAQFFREWGDVATVKIMWPRGEQSGRDKTGGLTGFVAFMTRVEAERAFREVDGAIWGGTRLKLSWGKAMALPNRAMYPMSRERRRMEEENGGRGGGGGGGAKGGVPKLVIRHRRISKQQQRERLRDRVEEGWGETQRLFIETVASRIKSNGGDNFETILRERERDNHKFSFLFDEESLLYQYFQTCIDPHYIPLKEQEEFKDQGSDDLYSTDSGEESESKHIRHHPSLSSTTSTTSSVPLGPLARHRLISMLRSITLRRDRIARITSFAIDHSSSYPTIVSLLVSSLVQPSTPIPRKIARLYALSDILHNSATPISNAWRYRAAIEAQLPLIFAHLGQIARSFGGRMKREEFRGKVLGVLEVWEGWIVVAPHVLERVRRVFDAPPVTSTIKAGEGGEGKLEEDLDGEMLGEESKTVSEVSPAGEEEDLDGVPLDAEPTANIQAVEEEDLNGEAMDQTPSAPRNAMAEEEDLDGAPL